jgi:tol-pal system protein YbgF
MHLLFLTLLSLLSFSVSAGPPKSSRLEQEVAELRRVQESNSRILAETVQNVAAIRQELQELRGAIEEARHFVEEGSRNNDRLLREFDYRLTGVEERLSLYGTQLEEFLSRTASAPAQPRGTARMDNDEDSLYRRALAEINTQNYKSALSLLDQFLKKYPKSSLVDNAQYWKGEALYASKDYPNAILEFQKVVKQYAKSEKVPGAILKQGYSFYEMKNYLDAKAFLQKVVTDFPQSDEAAAAKERIFKIDQLLAKAPPPATPARPAVPR